MAQFTQTRSASAAIKDEVKVLGLIGTGHFMSHFYVLTLPLLITFLAADYGFSPAQLGLFIAAFTSAAAVAQMPIGILVDRIGARAILFFGLLVEASAIGCMAFVSHFPSLLALSLLAGLGHSVFHPADYAIMVASVGERRIGRAFSIHTFSGNAGSAIAPMMITFLAALWHWKLALILISCFGIVVAFAVASQTNILKYRVKRESSSKKQIKQTPVRSIKANIRLMMTPPVLVLFAFFLVTTMATSGIQSFSIFTLVELHDTSRATASSALTAFLIASAVGVLAGGWLADILPRHDLIAAVSFLLTAAALVFVGEVNLSSLLLISVFAFIGILQGLVKPARDMMVRSAMPPGTAGTIFAFMSTGRLIGGAITPVAVGLLISNNATDKVFMLLAVSALLGLATLYMPRGASRSAGKAPD